MFCPQYLCYCDIITVKLASSSRDVNKAGSFKAKAKSLKAKAKCLKAFNVPLDSRHSIGHFGDLV